MINPYTLKSTIENRIEDFALGLNTSLIAKITSYNPSQQTVNLIPLYKERFEGLDGGIELPQLEDVPVVFPSGGGAILSFPLKPDDIVVVVFSQRSLEAFVTAAAGQQTQEITPASRQKFHLQDGMAFPCIYSWNDNLSPDNDSPQLKYKETTITLKENGSNSSDIEIVTAGQNGLTATISNGNISISVPNGTTTLTCDNITFNGNLQVNGTIDSTGNIHSDADVEAGSISLTNHTHGAGLLRDAEMRPLTGNTTASQ